MCPILAPSAACCGTLWVVPSGRVLAGGGGSLTRGSWGAEGHQSQSTLWLLMDTRPVPLSLRLLGHHQGGRAASGQEERD